MQIGRLALESAELRTMLLGTVPLSTQAVIAEKSCPVAGNGTLLAVFAGERAHLVPLPITGMQFFTESQRTVCDDSCVRVDHSSYAARPAAIGSRVLVRLFEHRIEIRDLRTQALLRTHTRVDRPGTVVLPMAERVFNPSRETLNILNQDRGIGPAAQHLCETLFAVQGRVA